MTMPSRRDFLKTFGAGIALVASGASFGRTAKRDEPSMIDMKRTDRKRNKSERYLIDIRSKEGLIVAAYLLRDIESGGIIGVPDMDTLRLAAWAQAWMTMHGRYTVLDVHSGLRMPAYNATLEKGAVNSRHLPRAGRRFSAVDVNPEGVDLKYFGDLVTVAKFGGVGRYKTHIHFDSREVPAYWRG